MKRSVIMSLKFINSHQSSDIRHQFCKLLVACGLWLAAISPTFAQDDERILVDQVAGIVGDGIILHSDIELQYQQMKLEGEVPEDFKCAILDQMLAQKLLVEQAMLDSIVIGEDEIESELDRRIRYFVSMIGSEEKLEEYYGKSIIQIKDEFRKDIEDQLLSNNMRSKILEKIKVTPSEVKNFFNAIPKDSLPYFNAEVEVGQIVLNPQPNIELKEYARKSLADIRQRIVDGEDFCVLASLYSEDPGSQSQCGDLGFIKRGEMVTEFEGAAFRLAENEISEVIESKFGFHIIQALEKKGEKIHVRHILIIPKTSSFDLVASKEKLDSIRSLIKEEKIKFNEAAVKFSEDEATKNQGGMLVNPQTGNTYFEIDQLDKSLYFAIENLMPGDISEPQLFQTPEGLQAYRIVYLKSESTAHAANLKDDYSRIKAAASQQKEEAEFQKWVLEKAKDIYVFVDSSYSDCPSLTKWLKNNAVLEKTYD